MSHQHYNLPADHAVRAEQARFAKEQSEADSQPRRTLSVIRPAKPPLSVVKGHEAFLKGLEHTGATVTFEKASNGEKIVGTVKTSDKYTVSIMQHKDDGSYITRVVFKHDISEFSPQPPTNAGKAV